MPTIELTTFPILLAFIVPGFVWGRVHRYLQTESDSTREFWVTAFALSAINYSIWFWLIPVLIVTTQTALEERNTPATWTLVGWFLITFVSPTFLGIATGFANRKGWLRSFLMKRLSINVLSPVGTAWDYAFGEVGHSGALWASVTMKDGAVVEGMFAGNSLASSKASERDLYLEFHAKVDDGKLVPVTDSAGVWLAADQIRAVEFRRVYQQDPQPENNDEQH